MPELLFNQGPGGLFIIRVAGNVENAEAVASLEYGTHFLGIPLIVVLGHSGCGAVDAAITVHKDKVKLPGQLPGLIDLILPAVKTAEAEKPTDLLASATRWNVRNAVKMIAETEPLLAAQVRGGTVKVVGAVYDIGSGRIDMV
jgi:carbonic anhydrase